MKETEGQGVFLFPSPSIFSSLLESPPRELVGSTKGRRASRDGSWYLEILESWKAKSMTDESKKVERL